MKATNLLALGALCIICVSGKLESGTSSVYNLISGSRHKRQMQVGPGGGTCSNEEQTRRLTAVVCNPVTGQRIVDVYLECNRDTTARGLVHSCIRNENQSFCFDVAVGASDYTNFVMTNCPRLSTYSGYQCTNSCRDALQNLKWNIGCCLNTRNYNASATFSNFLDAGLWSACRISRPGFCTDSTLMLGSVTSRNCSNEYLNEQMITQIYCSAEVFKPYIDVFQQCGFPSYYDYYINLCRVNENNEFCYRIASNVANYLRAIESQCHLDFTQGCFHSCQAALNNFKTAFGCCVNATISGSTVPNAINPAFWSACGISFPENCRSTLLFESANPPSSTNQTNASTTNQPDITAAIVGGVVAVAVVVAATVIVMVVTAFVAKRRTARFSVHQDAGKGPAKLGHVAKSGDEEVTTTQCEAYETTKLGYEYEDISGYENADYEIPVTQSSAYGLISKPGE